MAQSEAIDPQAHHASAMLLQTGFNGEPNVMLVAETELKQAGRLSIGWPSRWQPFIVTVEQSPDKAKCKECGLITFLAWATGYCLNHSSVFASDWLPDGTMIGNMPVSEDKSDTRGVCSYKREND